MPLDFSQYPPKTEKDRVAQYAQFERLFLGSHRQVFAAKLRKYDLRRYIVANFAGVVTRTAADLLFGEEPTYRAVVADPENEAGQAQAQARLDRIVKNNSLHLLGYECALATSFRGDGVLKVRFGQRNPADEQSAPEAIIEEVPASIFFPEWSEDNVRLLRRVTLAWQKKLDPSSSEIYLRMEEHEPGFIRHRLFKGKEELPLTTFPEYEGLEPEQETGLPFIPVFHIPNLRYGSRFWGISDYQGIESVLEALNSRVSHIDEVLDKHIAPKLVIPNRFVSEDGKVDLQGLEAVSLRPGEQPPSYITWDAHLEAAFTEVDKLLDLLMILTDTAPAMFGLDKYGVAESGRAMRLRLVRTLAKVNRKRLYFDEALKGALLAAMLLEQQFGELPDSRLPEPPQAPVIEWADGLPQDLVEAVEIEGQRLEAGNTSIQASIRRLDGPEQVEETLAEIEEERAKAEPFGGTRLNPTVPTSAVELQQAQAQAAAGQPAGPQRAAAGTAAGAQE